MSNKVVKATAQSEVAERKTAPKACTTPVRPQSTPLGHVQRWAGNLAIQCALDSGADSTGGALEQEADRMATAIQALEKSGATSATSLAPRSGSLRPKLVGVGSGFDGAIRSLGPGHRLSVPFRDFFESYLGQVLADVRVHTDARAGAAARSLGAQAFTYGSDIVFAPGRYQPETPRGRHLLAHELTHVVQQGHSSSVASQLGVSSGAKRIQTYPDEPSSTSEQPPSAFAVALNERLMWRYLGRKSHEMAALDERLRSAAPETEAQREGYRDQIEEMVRLNAIGILASHRASILATRDRTLQRPTGSAGATNAVMQTLRQVAHTLNDIAVIKERLEENRRELRYVESRSIRRSGSLNSAFDDLYENGSEFLTEDLRTGLRESFLVARSLGGGPSYWMYVYGAARALGQLRSQQILGLAQSQSFVHQRYPLFVELPAADVVGGRYETDHALWLAAARAFGRVVVNVDNAIRGIATEDIHPFDLPEAIRVTRQNLSDPLKRALDESIRAHELSQFWWNLGLTVAEIGLVFIPVVGPWLSLALGAATLGVRLEDVLDQALLEDVATDPYRNPLGVTGPTALDYVMLGVEGIMLAFSGAAIARQLRRGAPIRGVRAPREAVEPSVPRARRAAVGEELAEVTARARGVAGGGLIGPRSIPTQTQLDSLLNQAWRRMAGRGRPPPIGVDPSLSPRTDGVFRRWSNGMREIAVNARPATRGQTASTVFHETWHAVFDQRFPRLARHPRWRWLFRHVDEMIAYARGGAARTRLGGSVADRLGGLVETTLSPWLAYGSVRGIEMIPLIIRDAVLFTLYIRTLIAIIESSEEQSVEPSERSESGAR